jgi:hypothetical protein
MKFRQEALKPSRETQTNKNRKFQLFIFVTMKNKTQSFPAKLNKILKYFFETIEHIKSSNNDAINLTKEILDNYFRKTFCI